MPTIDGHAGILKRGVNSHAIVDEDGDEHWLWGHVNRLKRSINNLLQSENDDALNLKNVEIVDNRRRPNRLAQRVRRQNDDDDNEIDDDDADDDDTELAGSGHEFETTSDIYSLKPARLCE